MPDEKNPAADGGTTATPDVGTPPEHEGDPANPNREAAMRRRQLRAVETERDSLRDWREQRERADVEAAVAERLKDPADLWLATSLDAMRGDDGTISMDKVTGEIGRVLAEKKHWGKEEPKVEFPDLHQGPRGTVEPEGPSFGKALKQGRH